MKTIIAGTDFTISSINATEYAAFLAQKLGCKLTLFNMLDTPFIHTNVGLYGLSYTVARKSNQKKMEEQVQDLKKLFPKVKINSFITTADFKGQLEEFVASHHVEAAVMGLETKNKLSKFIYGSQSVDIAGKIKAPVIIVPQIYKSHKLSKIVLAVDNQEKLNTLSLKGFEKFVEESKSHISLLHVRTEDEIIHPVETEIKINSKKLKAEIIKAKTIEDGIKKYCSKTSADLVSIISKKHSPLYNLFNESTTKKVAFASKVPVMAIHE